MNWDSKIGFIDAVIHWLKEFDVLGVPKQCKLSYFFNPGFLNSVLETLLDVEDRVDLPKNCTNVNEQLSTLRKSPVEIFLDLVSTEFNKASIGKQNDADLSNESDNGESDAKDLTLEILNNFLESVNVEMLDAWSLDDVVNTNDENYDFQTIGKQVFKSAKSIFKNIGSGEVSNEENNSTLTEKDLMKYGKKPPRDVFIEQKVSSEIHDLHLDDLLNLIDQMFFYMSILFCVGIFSRRGAWGLVQMNYLSEDLKKSLKKWCVDVNYHYLDLGEFDDFEEAKSSISFNLESALSGAAGWLNVSGETKSAEKIVFKEMEELKSKCRQFSTANIKLLNEREDLNVKNDSLLSIISRLGNEVKDLETQLAGKCNLEAISLQNETKIIQQHKEAESALNGIIIELRAKINELKEENEATTKGFNNKIQKLEENSKKEDELFEHRIEELKKVYQETIDGLEEKMVELKFQHEKTLDGMKLEINATHDVFKLQEVEVYKKMEKALEVKESELKMKEDELKAREEELQVKEDKMKQREEEIDERDDNFEVLVGEFHDEREDLRKAHSEMTEQTGQAEKILAAKIREHVGIIKLLDEKNTELQYIKSQLIDMKAKERFYAIESDSKNRQVAILRKEKEKLILENEEMKSNFDKKVDQRTNEFYAIINQIQRDIADIKFYRDHEILEVKDEIFRFDKELNALEDKIVELNDIEEGMSLNANVGGGNGGGGGGSSSSSSRRCDVRRCADFKRMMEDFKDNKIGTVEMRLVIEKYEEVLFVDSKGRKYSFQEYDEFESIKVVITLKFLIDILNGRKDNEEIKKIYKEEMNKQMLRHVKLKECCKIQREKCIKYNELIKQLMNENRKVFKWVVGMNMKVKHVREVIDRLIKVTKDEESKIRLMKFVNIFAPLSMSYALVSRSGDEQVANTGG